MGMTDGRGTLLPARPARPQAAHRMAVQAAEERTEPAMPAMVVPAVARELVGPAVKAATVAIPRITGTVETAARVGTAAIRAQAEAQTPAVLGREATVVTELTMATAEQEAMVVTGEMTRVRGVKVATGGTGATAPAPEAAVMAGPVVKEVTACSAAEVAEVRAVMAVTASLIRAKAARVAMAVTERGRIRLIPMGRTVETGKMEALQVARAA